MKAVGIAGLKNLVIKDRWGGRVGLECVCLWWVVEGYVIIMIK